MSKKKQPSQTAEELKVQVATLGEEIYALRGELSLNRKLEKPHLLKAKKKERARALTLLTQLAISPRKEKRGA